MKGEELVVKTMRIVFRRSRHSLASAWTRLATALAQLAKGKAAGRIGTGIEQSGDGISSALATINAYRVRHSTTFHVKRISAWARLDTRLAAAPASRRATQTVKQSLSEDKHFGGQTTVQQKGFSRFFFRAQYEQRLAPPASSGLTAQVSRGREQRRFREASGDHSTPPSLGRTKNNATDFRGCSFRLRATVRLQRDFRCCD